MASRETGPQITEEPFLRTTQGKMTVVFLSAIMLLAASEITKLTKPKAEDPYDPNQAPTVVRMTDEELRRFFITPKPMEDIPSLRDIKHVLPPDVEKRLEEEGLTVKE